jgi:hypothetical protein
MRAQYEDRSSIRRVAAEKKEPRFFMTLLSHSI